MCGQEGCVDDVKRATGWYINEYAVEGVLRYIQSNDWLLDISFVGNDAVSNLKLLYLLYC